MNRPLACFLLFSLVLLLSALAPCQAKPSAPATAPALLSEADGYRFAFQYDLPRVPYIIIQVSGTSEPFTLPFVRASLFVAPPILETGLTMEKPDKRPIRVIQMDADSPAQRAGLMAGDTITAVDGAACLAMSADQTDDAFSRDTLTLTLQRPGESKPRVITLAK